MNKELIKALKKLGYTRDYRDRDTLIYAKAPFEVQIWADGAHRVCRTCGTTKPIAFTDLPSMLAAITAMEAK